MSKSVNVSWGVRTTGRPRTSATIEPASVVKVGTLRGSAPRRSCVLNAPATGAGSGSIPTAATSRGSNKHARTSVRRRLPAGVSQRQVGWPQHLPPCRGRRASSQYPLADWRCTLGRTIRRVLRTSVSSPPRIRRTRIISPISPSSCRAERSSRTRRTSGFEPVKRSMTERAVKVRLVDGVVLTGQPGEPSPRTL